MKTMTTTTEKAIYRRLRVALIMASDFIPDNHLATIKYVLPSSYGFWHDIKVVGSFAQEPGKFHQIRISVAGTPFTSVHFKY